MNYRSHTPEQLERLLNACLYQPVTVGGSGQAVRIMKNVQAEIARRADAQPTFRVAAYIQALEVQQQQENQP